MTQSEITLLQSRGFVLDDRKAVEDPAPAPTMEVSTLENFAIVDSFPLVDSMKVAFALPDIALQFNMGHFWRLCDSIFKLDLPYFRKN